MKRVLLTTALLVATTSVSGCFRVICPDGRMVVDSAGNPLVVYSIGELDAAERQHCKNNTDSVDTEPPANDVPTPTDTTETAVAVAVTTAVVAAVAGGGSSNSTNGTTK